jgi:regulator of replication initiation timing
MVTTTAASAVDSGASSTSPTEPTDTSATQAPASTQSRMLASIAAKRAAATAATAVTSAPGTPTGELETSGEPPGSSPGKDAALASDGEDAPDEKKRPDVMPLAAFQARLDKLHGNVKSAREESARLAHENQRYSTAAQLLQEENDRLRQQLREGAQYDARDEELADVRLSQRAKERADALAQEHEVKLREMQQNFVLEAEREQIKARLSTQIESALATHRLANRADVIAAMKSRHDLSAGEAARLIHEREVKRLEALGYAPRQSAPVASNAPIGARAPGGASGGTGRFANNARGMLDFLDARRQS